MSAVISRIGAVRTITAPSARLLAVCGKCTRKLDGGFGDEGAVSLTKALRRGLRNALGKRAEIRIVETRCLDICPKRAVALIDGNSPGEIVIVAAGTSVDELAARLELATA